MNKEMKIKALLKQVQSGKLENDKSRILDYGIRKRQFTINDICLDLCMIVQTASARISDLEDLGFLKVVGSIEDYTLFEVELDSNLRLQNANKRNKDKFQKWLSKADEFVDFIPSYIMPFLHSIKVNDQ